MSRTPVDMPRPESRVAAIALAFSSQAVTLIAQQVPVASRPLGRIVAISHEAIASLGGIRTLSDGRILVNDKGGRRGLLFDSTLASFTTVADTTSGTAKAYGTRPGRLFPYYGDSSIFVDQASISLLVIDPAGKIVRTIAAPLGPGNSVAYMIGSINNAALDGRGNVLYRFPWRDRSATAQLTKVPGLQPGVPPASIISDDSAVIIRINLVTKKRDTVATIATGGTRVTGAPLGTNEWSITSYQNAMPVSDDWTVMSDGTIAIVREASEGPARSNRPLTIHTGDALGVGLLYHSTVSAGIGLPLESALLPSSCGGASSTTSALSATGASSSIRDKGRPVLFLGAGLSVGIL